MSHASHSTAVGLMQAFGESITGGGEMQMQIKLRRDACYETSKKKFRARGRENYAKGRITHLGRHSGCPSQRWWLAAALLRVVVARDVTEVEEAWLWLLCSAQEWVLVLGTTVLCCVGACYGTGCGLRWWSVLSYGGLAVAC